MTHIDRAPFRLISCLTAIVLAGMATNAKAYSPPVDQAGPLKVRIAGPETVTELDTPATVQVVLENESDQSVSGRLQLRVIDRWRCEPSSEVPFTVPARGKSTSEFRVTAGQGTYSAHYPIHAYATFDWQGKSHTAHPILILETKLPAAARVASSLPWQPLAVSADRTLALLQVPVHRAVVTVFGKPPQVMPVGWSGAADVNRASVQRQDSIRLGKVARNVLAIHPPWAEGNVGTAWAEFPLDLPKATPIKLQFDTAVTPTGEGDGVTFRVRVVPLDAPDNQSGEAVFERHSAAKNWEPGEADLSRFAGQRVAAAAGVASGPSQEHGLRSIATGRNRRWLSASRRRPRLFRRAGWTVRSGWATFRSAAPHGKHACGPGHAACWTPPSVSAAARKSSSSAAFACESWACRWIKPPRR